MTVKVYFQIPLDFNIVKVNIQMHLPLRSIGRRGISSCSDCNYFSHSIYSIYQLLFESLNEQYWVLLR